jgi:hypothetical protein
LASRYTASGWTTAQQIHPLPSSGCPLLLRIRWNMLTESLLGNGYMRTHIENTSCVRVLRALPRNGSTLLLVVYLFWAWLLSRCLAMGLHVTVFSNLLLVFVCRQFSHDFSSVRLSIRDVTQPDSWSRWSLVSYETSLSETLGRFNMYK